MIHQERLSDCLVRVCSSISNSLLASRGHYSKEPEIGAMMASSSLNAKHAPEYGGGGIDTKPTASIDDGHLEHAPVANPAMEPPQLVKNMSHEERLHAEKLLVRKIDSRLLPAAIIMYVMNYLDRNNIAAARIAGPNGKGLQDELKLTSTQYQVSTSRNIDLWMKSLLVSKSHLENELLNLRRISINSWQFPGRRLPEIYRYSSKVKLVIDFQL